MGTVLEEGKGGELDAGEGGGWGNSLELVFTSCVLKSLIDGIGLLPILTMRILKIHTHVLHWVALKAAKTTKYFGIHLGLKTSSGTTTLVVSWPREKNSWVS